ncbi:uncharacterized protein I303_105046 [Kwoniella dejecticola CBS 10117]|uniref:Uncharacterized protein n=1 Tax=Kwoniella dejecticola CBS 10117 TaxID=1296121 RepID=A0A1A6A3L7_9TREE|nr:uncharacterized protein I303_05508 [Kwoniella dejecticola CBS 10117]OBR84649.1 hypothetical protein I303_05508 [Kwoniella dejecticola CBS 10117]
MALVSTQAPSTWTPSGPSNDYGSSYDLPDRSGKMNADGTLTEEGRGYFNDQRKALQETIRQSATDAESKELTDYAIGLIQRTIEDGYDLPEHEEWAVKDFESWTERAPRQAYAALEAYQAIMNKKNRKLFREAAGTRTVPDTVDSETGPLPITWATPRGPSDGLTQYPSEGIVDSDSDSGSSSSTAMVPYNASSNAVATITAPDTQYASNDPTMYHLRTIGKTAHPSLLPGVSLDSEVEGEDATTARKSAIVPHKQSFSKPMADWLASRQMLPASALSGGSGTGQSRSPFAQSDATDSQFPSSMRKLSARAKSLVDDLLDTMDMSRTDVAQGRIEDADGRGHRDFTLGDGWRKDGARTQFSCSTAQRGPHQISMSTSYTVTA